jgi:hypothetical protein
LPCLGRVRSMSEHFSNRKETVGSKFQRVFKGLPDLGRVLECGKNTIGFRSHTFWFPCFLWLRDARVYTPAFAQVLHRFACGDPACWVTEEKSHPAASTRRPDRGDVPVELSVEDDAKSSSDAANGVVIWPPLIAIYFNGFDRLESIFSIACCRLAISRHRQAISR